MILSAKLADWQTVEDYPSWRHARKLKVLPDDSLWVASHAADSTKEEAQMLYRFLNEHGYNNVILVTSNYHTRRAKRIFEEQWEDTGVKVFVSAASSAQFHPDEWWKHRADSRTFSTSSVRLYGILSLSDLLPKGRGVRSKGQVS